MTRTIIVLVLLLTKMTSFSQIQEKKEDKSVSNISFRLFSTQNMWTFLKLNTRNGMIWQVQYHTDREKRFESSLNTTPRVDLEDEVNDRFTLYPTQNIYTFIMLDQIDGRTWQIQWSTEPKDRLMLRIY